MTVQRQAPARQRRDANQDQAGRRSMSDVEDSQLSGGVVHAFPTAGREQRDVTFGRQELSEILRVYGRMVAAGEWRDYAIDHGRERAVFSVFRRTAEAPLYRIEKNPRLANRQGAYAVVSTNGMILKRGPDLARVLRVFDSHLKLVDA
jgi:hypothetical protein